MIIETQFGNFELIKNYRDGFDIALFNEKYVDVAFDRYTFIVGDISSGIMRLKGFANDPKSPNSFKKIPDYLNESCNTNTAYFILKRLKEKEIIELQGSEEDDI
jgi:uncharacterized protein YutD